MSPGDLAAMTWQVAVGQGQGDGHVRRPGANHINAVGAEEEGMVSRGGSTSLSDRLLAPGDVR